jgi:hypothetical protein
MRSYCVGDGAHTYVKVVPRINESVTVGGTAIFFWTFFWLRKIRIPGFSVFVFTKISALRSCSMSYGTNRTPIFHYFIISWVLPFGHSPRLKYLCNTFDVIESRLLTSNRQQSPRKYNNTDLLYMSVHLMYTTR